MKQVLYNKDGFVAHISFPITTKDSFAALAEAATHASSMNGVVEALYDDTKGGRVRIGGVEKAGLVLEFGTLDESDNARIRELEEALRTGGLLRNDLFDLLRRIRAEWDEGTMGTELLEEINARLE